MGIISILPIVSVIFCFIYLLYSTVRLNFLRNKLKKAQEFKQVSERYFYIFKLVINYYENNPDSHKHRHLFKYLESPIPDKIDKNDFDYLKTMDEFFTQRILVIEETFSNIVPELIQEKREKKLKSLLK